MMDAYAIRYRWESVDRINARIWSSDKALDLGEQITELVGVLSRCLTSGRAEGSTEVSEYLSGNHPPLGHCG